jgi:hypothetical protein
MHGNDSMTLLLFFTGTTGALILDRARFLHFKEDWRVYFNDADKEDDMLQSRRGHTKKRKSAGHDEDDDDGDQSDNGLDAVAEAEAIIQKDLKMRELEETLGLH